MKAYRLLFLFLLGLALGLPQSLQAEQKAPLKTKKDKISYSIGLDIGRRLKEQGIDVDVSVLSEGLKDAVTGSEARLSPKEIHEVMVGLQNDLRTKRMEHMKVLAEKNKKEGEAFLAKNKKKSGIITTASGLQYKVITAGKGKSPAASDTVVVNYRGKLLNGTEFDSSYARGKPATFPVSGVIPGWTEVLQLMKPGAKWMVYIPSKLAYGEHGAGGKIGPNSTLVFEVELVKVKPHKAKKG